MSAAILISSFVGAVWLLLAAVLRGKYYEHLDRPVIAELERERKALRKTLAHSVAYVERLESAVKGGFSHGNARRLLDSAPPLENLIVAINRRDWERYDRILAGEK